MDARTQNLIALVKDGATLRDAGRVYGISGERVRQLLKEAGVSTSDLPGRAAKPRTTRSFSARGVAPVVETATRPGGGRSSDDATSSSERLSAAALCAQLDRFEAALQASGLRESTIHAYLLGSSLFVRWLAGDYVPGRRRLDRVAARSGNVSADSERLKTP